MNSQLNPSPIKTDSSNPFAQNTMRERLPRNIRSVTESNPHLSAADCERLEALATRISEGEPIPPPQVPAPDHDEWYEQFCAFEGDRWNTTEWFFGETYAYRLLLDACRFWEHGRDPFIGIKEAEFAADVVFETVRAFFDLHSEEPADTHDSVLRAVYASLWGNRSDLSFGGRNLRHRLDRDAELLIVDDGESAAAQLLSGTGPVHLVLDNCGAELAGDLLLAHELLRQSDKTVVLHVKIHPTYISDTTVADFHHLLDEACESTDEHVRSFGRFLRAAFEAGRIIVAPDSYWCSTRFLLEMPPRIRRSLDSASTVVFKGDFNYRRVVRDTNWPPDTPVRAAAGGIETPPWLLLRTMKSDAAAGVPAKVYSELEAADPEWRTNGRRGMIQLVS